MTLDQFNSIHQFAGFIPLQNRDGSAIVNQRRCTQKREKPHCEATGKY